ncbi:MAG: hypothetical protein ABW061_17315 [Polyangiaceae bacterium]
MNKLRTLILSAALTWGLPTQAMAAADGWGASFSFGPSTSRIIYAKTTMVPGRLPPIKSGTGPLFIWPGMSNSKGDLIQTTIDAWPDNAGYCKAAAGQWCVEASVFGSFGQRNGPTVPLAPDDHVTIEYKLGSDGNTWTQTVTLAGKVVSTLDSASGPMPGTGFGFATEADADSYTIDTQYYLCTEFHFAVADPKFGSTGGGGNGAKYGATGTGSGPGTAKNLRTPDGGLTWLVDLITLPAMQPQGTQTPPPAINCTPGGAGGSGAGGATGSAGAGAGGGSTAHGGMGGSAAGGAPGSAGNSSAGNGSAGIGTGGSASGGASAAGGSGGSAGASSAGGGLAAGGASSSSAGAAGTKAAGGGSNAGSSSTPPADGSDSSGCSCGVQRKSGSGSPLLFGLLAASVMARRRKPRAASSSRY